MTHVKDVCEDDKSKIVNCKDDILNDDILGDDISQRRF